MKALANPFQNRLALGCQRSFGLFSSGYSSEGSALAVVATEVWAFASLTYTKGYLMPAAIHVAGL